LNRGFHVSEKSHFQVSKKRKSTKTKRGTLEQTAKIAFSWPQNTENELTPFV